MNDDLKTIAIASRKAIEHFAKDHPEIGDPKDLGCYCAIASYLLYLVAHKFGYKLTLVEGNAFDDYYRDYVNHCWIQYKGTVIDITATQFECPNKIHITDIYDEDYKTICRSSKVRKNLKKDWGEQSPYEYIKELQDIADGVASKIAA